MGLGSLYCLADVGARPIWSLATLICCCPGKNQEGIVEMIIAEQGIITLPMPLMRCVRALLDGGHERGYKRAMKCPFTIATRFCGRITGPAR
jgi:hypothetical protein